MSQAQHVGIIMDGNRRFSKKLMQTPWKGHKWGAKKLEEVLTWCKEAGVKRLTVFALSIQNFSRPKKEFEFLMQLFSKELDNLLTKNDELAEQGLRVEFIGRVQLLPEEVQQRLQAVQEATKDNKRFVLTIAVAYGGREEIVDAARAVALQVACGELTPEEVDEEVFARKLYASNEPDLIIRTGGEQRTSNFLSWQSIYTEWFFVKELWPEFSKETFTECLEEFRNRQRRFGK